MELVTQPHDSHEGSDARWRSAYADWPTHYGDDALMIVM